MTCTDAVSWTELECCPNRSRNIPFRYVALTAWSISLANGMKKMFRKINICKKCEHFKKHGKMGSRERRHTGYCDINHYYAVINGLFIVSSKRRVETRKVPDECPYKTEQYISEWNRDEAK